MYNNALLELIKIIKSGYINNTQFKRELLLSLARKTGDKNICTLCAYIIDSLHK
ncbi:MAG: hypothetical protein PWR27_2198 [Petroclostridium sp.]|jgi:hypothetical protein|nr:hypothetical protein [Clostridia bacterium]MDK2811489.1 hypothetical protein [Petroclostridium sp.]